MDTKRPDMFFKIPTMLVTYRGGIRFNVYIKSGDTFFLYARDGHVPERLKSRLCDNEVTELYLEHKDKRDYEQYVRENLSDLLQDETIPLDDRSKVLYDYSGTVAARLFLHDEQSPPGQETLERVQQIVDSTLSYVSRNAGAVQSLGKLLSHNYKTFSHCVNVSVYTVALLVRMGQERSLVRAAGVGAFLHDIGKVRVPNSILDKPGPLTPEERQIIEGHPVSGMLMCQHMSLEKASMDCVVFHHEKLDGSGYPANARNLGLHVRAVAVADIYDALTSQRSYSKAMTSFEAMRIILKEVEAGRLDREVCTHFVQLLSSEGMTL
ncbi:HD domain-containing protein [Fundidesulfovibrio butyratiphilus]